MGSRVASGARITYRRQPGFQKTMTQIRVITPIISRGFRDDGPLRACVPDGCGLDQVFLENGPASVESAVDEVLAGPGVIDAALAAEADGVQAIVIDCMLDPALDAAREAVSIPVIGCGEAGMAAAVAHGPFSIITVLQRQERDFRALAAKCGLGNGLVSVRGIGISVLDLERRREASIAATIRGAQSAAAEDGAVSIVFGCTGMLGFADPVAEALGWHAERVIDPLPHAVAVAHAAARNGALSDKLLYPEPEAKEVRGFTSWPHLDAKMAGQS